MVTVKLICMKVFRAWGCKVSLLMMSFTSLVSDNTSINLVSWVDETQKKVSSLSKSNCRLILSTGPQSSVHCIAAESTIN